MTSQLKRNSRRVTPAGNARTKGQTTMYKNNISNFKNAQGTIFHGIPSDSNLADRWINQYPLTIWHNKKFYRPNDAGVYFVVDEMIIKQEILKVMREAEAENYRPTAKRMYSVLELARIVIAVTKENFIVAGGEK